MERFAVIVPAAGTGTRFGGGDKLLMEIGGETVLRRSVGLFTAREDVGRVVVVTGAERMEAYREHLAAGGGRLAGDGGKVEFVVGGRERWESVLNGLRHLVAGMPAGCQWYWAGAEMPAGGGQDGGMPAGRRRYEGAVERYVGVHDAARPLCPAEVIEEAFAATVKFGAGLPCVAEPATLKRRGAGGEVVETVARAGLYQAQTPQCFGLRELLEGYEELLRKGRVADLTDDAQVFERMGRKVMITAGSAVNMKITTVGDLAVARALVG